MPVEAPVIRKTLWSGMARTVSPARQALARLRDSPRRHDATDAARPRPHRGPRRRGRQRLPVVPARGARAQGRARRRRRRPRRRRVLRCDDNLRDLQSFRRRAHFRAERGGHGQGAQRHGADGEPLVIARPARHAGRRAGTARATTSCGPGQEVTVARGGVRRARQHALQVVRSARRRGSPSAGCRARRASSSCTSSCSPTSGSSGCRTPASRRCSRA